jgi:hypothetical protein
MFCRPLFILFLLLNDQKKDRRYNDQKKEDRQHNEQKKEDKQWSTKHTYKHKDLTTQTPKDNKINCCRRV